jgi:glycosyltransferase 2 family protein
VIDNFLKLLHTSYQKRTIRVLIVGSLTLFVLFILLSILYANWDILAKFQWEINPWALGATFATYTLGLFSIIFGWFLLIRHLAPEGGFNEHFNIYVLTNLAKRIPGPLTHIAGRLVMYKELGIGESLVALASGIEAVLLLISAIITYLLALTFSNGEKYFLGWFVFILLIGISTVHPKIITFLLHKLKGQENTPSLRYKNLLLWLAFYVIGWGLGGITLFWLINTLTPLPFSKLPDVVAAWTLAGSLSSLIFFSPSGLGVQEITLVVSIGRLIPEPVAVIVAILLRILLLSYQLIWAGLIILSRRLSGLKVKLILPKDY